MDTRSAPFGAHMYACAKRSATGSNRRCCCRCRVPCRVLCRAVPPPPQTKPPRRGQLKALVDIHGADEGLGGNLTEDEIKVICGALDLTSKTARK